MLSRYAANLGAPLSYKSEGMTSRHFSNGVNASCWPGTEQGIKMVRNAATKIGFIHFAGYRIEVIERGGNFIDVP